MDTGAHPDYIIIIIHVVFVRIDLCCVALSVAGKPGIQVDIEPDASPWEYYQQFADLPHFENMKSEQGEDTKRLHPTAQST